jgi:glycerophosphoryl diester phosphodiesterase
VITPAAVRRVHARGAAAIAWTVNDRADLERVVQAGVDGVVTDDPTVFDGPRTAVPRQARG